ncbi:MAG: hypothetical protein JOZ52_06795 [Acidobacteria bacterium]|nr:hypothetical protein [Acidobacteriota bacterium]
MPHHKEYFSEAAATNLGIAAAPSAPAPRMTSALSRSEARDASVEGRGEAARVTASPHSSLAWELGNVLTGNARPPLRAPAPFGFQTRLGKLSGASLLLI